MPSASRPDPPARLRDGGIDWVFTFREADVPRRELEIGNWTRRNGYLRLAVTYGRQDWDSDVYRSRTSVHLWRMASLPPSVSWREVFVHVFTHEPLHHAIGLALAEMGEHTDHEWVIAQLGDGRWW